MIRVEFKVCCSESKGGVIYVFDCAAGKSYIDCGFVKREAGG